MVNDEHVAFVVEFLNPLKEFIHVIHERKMGAVVQHRIVQYHPIPKKEQYKPLHQRSGNGLKTIGYESYLSRLLARKNAGQLELAIVIDGCWV